MSEATPSSGQPFASTTRVGDGLVFAEVSRSGFQQRFHLKAHLWEGRSEYQHVEIVDTVAFGKALVLDDAMQTTEADEFLYHEPLVHIPLLAHPNPRRVLVVGGGDGGALRHVLLHASIEKAVMVEIDELVVRACQEWLPSLAGGAFEHPRAELIIGDGLAYMRDVSEPFDVILVDSTDPVGPAEGLISEEFYRLAFGALSEHGIFAMQTGSPLLMRDELESAAGRMSNVFPIVRTYLGHVPAYPGVLWSWTAGSKSLDPSEPRRTPPAGLRFYTPDVHRGAFALPPYLAASSEGADHAAAGAATRGPILG
ncbi:MAG: polyamine aminopropyltransferase [Chloroflexi bacterium]|nr:polyamine aminopropyltransferase [Chloroflexota bacterium]